MMPKRLFQSRVLLCPMVALVLVGAVGCSSEGVFDSAPAGIDQYAAGLQYQKAGDRAAAIGSFKEAIRINPNLQMPRVKLAEIYRKEGDYQTAATLYETAVRLDPYSATTAANLGLCYQLLHRLADAVVVYLRALNIDPTNFRANMNIGLVYLALGHLNEAEHYLHHATQLDPKSAEAWSNYGVSLDALGRLPEAEAAYRHALEVNAGSTSTLENLASNLIAQRQAAEALAVCQQLLLRSDTSLSRTRYGQALLLSGQTDAAMEQYKLASQRDPNFYLPMTAEGFLLIDEYQKGMELNEPQRESALALFASSLRLNPNQPRVVAAIRQWQTSQLMGK